MDDHNEEDIDGRCLVPCDMCNSSVNDLCVGSLFHVAVNIVANFLIVTMIVTTPIILAMWFIALNLSVVDSIAYVIFSIILYSCICGSGCGMLDSNLIQTDSCD